MSDDEAPLARRLLLSWPWLRRRVEAVVERHNGGPGVGRYRNWLTAGRFQ